MSTDHTDNKKYAQDFIKRFEDYFKWDLLHALEDDLYGPDKEDQEDQKNPDTIPLDKICQNVLEHDTMAELMELGRITGQKKLQAERQELMDRLTEGMPDVDRLSRDLVEHAKEAWKVPYPTPVVTTRFMR